MKPSTARAFASRRRAHSRVPGPESLSLGSLGGITRTVHSKDQDDIQFLSRIVGEQLSAVVFVQDYLQLQFDGPTLTLLTPISVRSSSGGVVTEREAGWRDTLCAQITCIVQAIRIADGDLIVDFDDGSAICVSIRPEDYRCAEAVHLVEDGRVSVVF